MVSPEVFSCRTASIESVETGHRGIGGREGCAARRGCDRHGVYFRESLGASHPQDPAGEIGPTGEGEASNPHGPRWWVLVLLALVIGIIVGMVLAHAGEPTRADLFDAQGRRTGYSVAERTQAGPATHGESTSPRGD